MKFRYKKYSQTHYRPIIPIELRYKHMSIKYEVLIDSGADLNILDADIADVLGIDLITGETSSVSGLTGVSKQYHIHPIDLVVGGYVHKNVKTGFLKGMGNYGHGIVGQKGFFDLFIVKFDLKKLEIELKPHTL